MKKPFNTSVEERILKYGLISLPEKESFVENAVGYVNGAISERKHWKKVVIASIPRTGWGIGSGLAAASVLCVVLLGVMTGHIDISRSGKSAVKMGAVIFTERLQDSGRIKKVAEMLDSARSDIYNASKTPIDSPLTKSGFLDSISARIDSCRQTLAECR